MECLAQREERRRGREPYRPGSRGDVRKSRLSTTGHKLDSFDDIRSCNSYCVLATDKRPTAKSSRDWPCSRSAGVEQGARRLAAAGSVELEGRNVGVNSES